MYLKILGNAIHHSLESNANFVCVTENSSVNDTNLLDVGNIYKQKEGICNYASVIDNNSKIISLAK